MFSQIMHFAMGVSRASLLGVIRAYQKTLSPDHGFFRARHPQGFCRFYPTCSEYAHEAISRYGLMYGSLKAGWRILRCNPWSKGGVDEIHPPS